MPNDRGESIVDFKIFFGGSYVGLELFRNIGNELFSCGVISILIIPRVYEHCADIKVKNHHTLENGDSHRLKKTESVRTPSHKFTVPFSPKPLCGNDDTLFYL